MQLAGLELDRPVGMLTDLGGMPLGFDFTNGGRAKGHTATYPVAMIEPIIKASTRPGDAVFDPFTGSGTTALAALALGRKFVGTELSVSYKALADRGLRSGTVNNSGGDAGPSRTGAPGVVEDVSAELAASSRRQ
jgi:hypothetical protein